MPYADNRGIKIHYEVEGQGPPILLASGMGWTTDNWRRYGYVDALKSDFKLILFDTRGFGKSDKPHEPSAYACNLIVDDVIAVVNNAKIDKVHYFGYSLGGRVGYHVATLHASRFLSFIFGGQSPYRRDPPNPNFYDIDSEQSKEIFKILPDDPERFFQERGKLIGRALTAQERDNYMYNDVDVLVAWTEGLRKWIPLTNDEISGISVPCLLFCGELDGGLGECKEGVTHMPNAEFVCLPGFNHQTAFQRSEVALPYIKKFLAEVS